jgi:hypothetical protein
MAVTAIRDVTGIAFIVAEYRARESDEWGEDRALWLRSRLFQSQTDGIHAEAFAGNAWKFIGEAWR